jgi:hypothetical protein
MCNTSVTIRKFITFYHALGYYWVRIFILVIKKF